MEEIVRLKRDITAIQVPFGTPALLAKDTEVTVAYSLGGSYTITANGSMYRVESQDADALGKTTLTFSLAGNENSSLEDKVWAILHTCYDPEIPVDIVDLGLIYGIDITAAEENMSNVKVRMTLTAPGCGMGPVIAEDARQKVLSLPEVKEVAIEMVFDPPWDRSMMSEQAKLELGLM
ncbi:MAG: putative Fe-S cluster assembly protein SufT [Gammaproteobacteria bacterium]|nr:putative Fe-S cluster assembly protein SufT [Gammaproteobacteria bacterium]